MPRPNRLRARQRILESLNGGFTKRLAETGQVSEGVVSWITVQTVSTLITGKIVRETGKCVAEKWHFLALFGRFWRGLQCHFSCPERAFSRRKLSICWLLCRSHQPATGILESAKKGVVGAPTKKVAKIGKRPPMRRMGDREQSGHAILRSLPIYNIRGFTHFVNAPMPSSACNLDATTYGDMT
jgi:hypothetical protein